MQGNLEHMVREHGDMVLRLAVSYTHSTADAEDVFQEVFIRLVRSLDKIENEAHLKHWLIRTTVNRCKSLFASASRRRELVVEELPDAIDTSEEASVGNEPETPATDAVRNLPEKYRVPIHLFYFEELTIQEIAHVLDSTEGTVKSQLSRGRKMLGEALKEVGHV